MVKKASGENVGSAKGAEIENVAAKKIPPLLNSSPLSQISELKMDASLALSICYSYMLLVAVG
jgi:hypothetical protein